MCPNRLWSKFMTVIPTGAERTRILGGTVSPLCDFIKDCAFLDKRSSALNFEFSPNTSNRKCSGGAKEDNLRNHFLGNILKLLILPCSLNHKLVIGNFRPLVDQTGVWYQTGLPPSQTLRQTVGIKIENRIS